MKRITEVIQHIPQQMAQWRPWVWFVFLWCCGLLGAYILVSPFRFLIAIMKAAS